MQRLLAAKRDLRLPQELAQLDRYACLVLDDIGYVQHDRDEMEVLFTLLAERYERRSVAISTNLVFSRLGAHLQGPDDDDGGHRPRRAPLGHPRPDAGGELPRPGRPRPAAPRAPAAGAAAAGTALGNIPAAGAAREGAP